MYKQHNITSSLESAVSIPLGQNISTEGISDIFNSLSKAWRNFLDSRLMKRGKVTERDMQRLASTTRALRRHVAKTYAHERWIELRFNQLEQYTIQNARALYIGEQLQDNGTLSIADNIENLNKVLYDTDVIRSEYVHKAMHFLLGSTRTGVHVSKGQLMDFYAVHGHYEDVLSKLDRKFPVPSPMGHSLINQKGTLKYIKHESIKEDPITKRGMTLSEAQQAGKNLLRLLDVVIRTLDARRYGILDNDYEYLVEIGYLSKEDSVGNVEEKVIYENIVPEVIRIAKSTGDKDVLAIFSYEEWNRRHGDAMYQCFDFALEAIQTVLDSVNQHLR